MLTWQSNEGLAFDKETLEQSRSFRTPMADGWGLTVADDGVENAFLCGILV
jgi:glutamine cyclotransferase